MFILILGVVLVPIILNELLENHDARPQQHDVLRGFLEQLVGFHRFFSTGDEVLQSFKLFTNLIIITALWFERVNRGAGASFSVVMWVSSSPSCYSLCGSFEGELVTVPSDCGHGNNWRRENKNWFCFGGVALCCEVLGYTNWGVIREEGGSGFK